MSGVQKYDPFGYDGLSALMHEDKHGEWVRVENYELAAMERDAALAECERLKRDRKACLAEFKAMTRSCLDAERERDAALKQVDGLRSDLLFLAEYIAAESAGNPLPNYLAVGRFPVDVARAAMSAKP